MVNRNLFLAVELQARRLWVTVGWAIVLLVIYLSLTPTPIDVPIEAGDKLSHAFAYLVLMSWFSNLYEGPGRRVGFAVGFVFLGVTLEILQGGTGYRSFEVADMLADAAGVVVGWIVAPPRLPNYLQLVEKVCKA